MAKRPDLKSVRYAFRQTIPVMCGYLFLGISFGLLLQRAGYNALWAFASSALIYAGSMQFVLVGILGSGMGLLTVALMTLSVNCRHIFYGLSFLEKFRAIGRAYPYMVFSLTDETYSLLCALAPPTGTDEKKTAFWISLLDHIYWVAGSVMGSFIGEILPFDATGIDFAMTALFTVIFVEQWRAAKSHYPALVGLGCGALSLVLFGADKFILPALLSTVGLLLAKNGWKGRQAHD